MRFAMANHQPNVDQLRAAIDTGKTADKVDFPDPAAAPLGTDDEASGYSPSSAQVKQSLNAETVPSPRGKDRRSIEGFPTAYIVIAIALIAIILATVMLASRQRFG
jgi:hypothetical protein